MKHILVPYDGSEQAEKAFDLALSFAKKYGADILVLSVARVSEPPEDEETETMVESAQQHYAEQFKALKNKAKDYPSLQLRFKVNAGHPAEQIIYTAETNDIDHIVMGHRGKTIFRRWLLGSVAKQVMIYASCAITIVR